MVNRPGLVKAILAAPRAASCVLVHVVVCSALNYQKVVEIIRGESLSSVSLSPTRCAKQHVTVIHYK